jgi:hypothetical protein
MPFRTRLPYLVPILLVAALAQAAPPAAYGFGTINGLGQNAEHERLTRAALACPAGTPSTGDCFEPRSIDQLAGTTGTFGAVGAPDADETLTPSAHCDDADFLAGGGYPRTRAQADSTLLACVQHLRGRFGQGVTAAAGMLNSANQIRFLQVLLTPSCTFVGGVPGRAKCNAIDGLGRALHGAQDFYSHSNWTDHADPARPISAVNPPGLARTGPSAVLDLRGTGTPAIPTDLTTGCFALGQDQTPGAGTCTGRITHNTMNKDLGLIDPATGATSNPTTARGQVDSNFANAVQGAIAETRRQWRDFRDALLARYGAVRGNLMICALTRDNPTSDC